MMKRALASWQEFGRLIKDWVVKAMETLMHKYVREDLLPDYRAPVNGDTGIGIGQEPGEADDGYDANYIGLYGIPLPNSGSQDLGVLWTGGPDTWGTQDASDWAPDFAYPPGMQVGNVCYSNADNDIITWMWKHPGDMSNEQSSTKYCVANDDFRNWFEEVQSGSETDPTTQHVYNRGYILTVMPAGYACMGACVFTGTPYLIAVGIDTQTLSNTWTDTGVAVYQGLGTSTFTTISGTTLPFGPGDLIRIDGRESANVYQAYQDPPGSVTWHVQLNAALSYTIEPGMSIEISTVTDGQVTVFGTPLTKGALDGRLTAPTSAWVELASSGTNFREFTQQFCGNPVGDALVGMSHNDDTKTSAIHRINIDWSGYPASDPVATWTTEDLSTIRELRVDVTQVNQTSGCDDSIDDGTWPSVIESWNGCEDCTGSTGIFKVGVTQTFPDKTNVYEQAKTTQQIGVTHSLDPATASHLIAMDFLDDGTEAKMTHEVTYTGSMLVDVENSYSSSETRGGAYSASGVGCDPGVGTSSGTSTTESNQQSTFSASKRALMDFKLALAVNGFEVVELGRIEDDFSWVQSDDSRTGYQWQRTVYQADGVSAGGGPPIETAPCWDPVYGALAYETYSALSDGGTVTQGSGGTIVTITCGSGFDGNYLSWGLTPATYEFHRQLNQLTFADIRAGVFVIRKQEGAIELYGTGDLTNLDNKILPYKLTAYSDVVIPTDNSRWSLELKKRTNTGGYSINSATGDPPLEWATITNAEPKSFIENPINIQPVTWYCKLGQAASAGINGAVSRQGYRMVYAYEETDGGLVTLQESQIIGTDGLELTDPLGEYTGAPGATQNVHLSAL